MPSQRGWDQRERTADFGPTCLKPEGLGAGHLAPPHLLLCSSDEFQKGVSPCFAIRARKRWGCSQMAERQGGSRRWACSEGSLRRVAVARQASPCAFGEEDVMDQRRRCHELVEIQTTSSELSARAGHRHSRLREPSGAVVHRRVLHRRYTVKGSSFHLGDARDSDAEASRERAACRASFHRRGVGGSGNSLALQGYSSSICRCSLFLLIPIPTSSCGPSPLSSLLLQPSPSPPRRPPLKVGQDLPLSPPISL